MAPSSRVFELRTYHAVPGRLDALHARFRDHTVPLFDKHGIAVIGFWTPQDGQQPPGDTLVYLLAFSDRDAAEAAWSSFRADPAWTQAKVESEERHGGSLTTAIESVFLTPTDYSPLR
ncbi:MAG TPA: NIPSNAP family protein [Acidimicrobiales bacterium]|nr:NIPSNAP family protein [Acidimicrobiales bacterium]